MIVVGILTAMLILNRYFMLVSSKYLSEGIRLGAVWFIINIVLDLIVLVGLFKSPVGEYFTGVGIRYLAMPIMSIGLGWIINKKTSG